MYQLKQRASAVLSEKPFERLYGIGEVLRKKDTSVRGYDLDVAIELMKRLGAKSHRLWILSSLFRPDLSIDRESADEYHEVIRKLRDIGVEQIVGLGSFYNLLNGGIDTYVPYRGDEGYETFMAGYETIWRNLAEEFPDLAMFELGNETNFANFLSPDRSGKRPCGTLERADITTDLMFFACKGVKSANPEAYTVLPGMSPTEKGMASGEMEIFLERIYHNIESGEFGSTDKRDFFDGLAWHPYTFITPFSDVRWGYEPDMEWVRQNDRIFDVARRHGDGDLRVFLTEYGYSDFGNRSDCLDYAKYLRISFELIRKHMPYVEAVHVFRLFEDTLAENWGGKTEIYYGLFKEPRENLNFTPKPTAYEIQKIFGGTGDLNVFNKLDKE